MFLETRSQQQKQKDGAVTFQKESNGKHRYTWSADAIPLNKWSHIAAVFDNSLNTVRVYINGELKGSSDLGTDLPDTNAVIWLGGYGPFYYRQYGSQGMFRGYIDDVRIWSIARSENQILNNMLVGRISGDEPEL